MNSAPRPSGREAIKAWHRQKIIDATIDVINQHGIAGTTIAKVVERAEVSMGLVNVHFKSKDALLAQVLQQMAQGYQLHWRDRVESAALDPVAQLSAMVLADFDASVLNLKTLGVWFAFRAQVRARPEYLELVGTREAEQVQLTISLFRKLNRKTGQKHDPATLTRLLAAMVEGMWTEFHLYPREFDRAKALQGVFLFLSVMYPDCFAASDANSFHG
ncbi:MAG: TetR family transcriptional regulator [Gammaproteobacteria bacterium]|nr:TetR family transcriptional regulator [Gammaproteobacteria bacterium]